MQEKLKTKNTKEHVRVLQGNPTLISFHTSEVPTPASKRLRTDPPQLPGLQLEVENAELNERAATSVSMLEYFC